MIIGFHLQNMEIMVIYLLQYLITRLLIVKNLTKKIIKTNHGRHIINPLTAAGLYIVILLVLQN